MTAKTKKNARDVLVLNKFLIDVKVDIRTSR
jgi:hypothetical protein